jgi:hypothetical protein
MIAGKELLASSTSPIAIAHALGWPRCLKDFVYRPLAKRRSSMLQSMIRARVHLSRKNNSHSGREKSHGKRNKGAASTRFKGSFQS